LIISHQRGEKMPLIFWIALGVLAIAAIVALNRAAKRRGPARPAKDGSDGTIFLMSSSGAQDGAPAAGSTDAVGASSDGGGGGSD
jgi:hypothetical protein